MSLTHESIQQAFNENNVDINSDALNFCISIAKEMELDAKTMAVEWDLYSLEKKYDGPADMDHLKGLQAKLLQQKAKANNLFIQKHQYNKENRNRTPVAKRKTTQMAPSVNKESLNSLYGVQMMQSPRPSKAPAFLSPQGSYASKKLKGNALFSPASFQSPDGNNYEKRQDAGRTVDEFNAELKKELSKYVAATSKVDIKIPKSAQNAKASHSYMYTPLNERTAALEAQLNEAHEYFEKHLDNVTLGTIGDPSPAQVTVVGRVCCEAAEGKLNLSVTMLEGSRKYCGGQRVLIDMTAVPSFSLFPGKIVALEGVYNSISAPMVVKRVLEEYPAPMPTTKLSSAKSEDAMEVDDEGNEPLRIVLASGPFTGTDNVQFLPLNDLIELVQVDKPNVLILLGPFIDASHPQFKEGLVKYDDMIVSYMDIFLFKVAAQLEQLLRSNPDMHVVLVPSVRDIHHDYVFPQPAFEASKIYEVCEHKNRLHLMSNPSVFSINDIVFGVSTMDVLFQLGSNELYRSNGTTTPRLIRLAQHVIDQRSFYPIFPPPANGDAPIDVRFQKNYKFQETPDILILPSILNRFCGKVRDSLCINPGQLSKGAAGGTFASVSILPLKNNKASEDNEVPHDILSRAHVVIKKI